MNTSRRQDCSQPAGVHLQHRYSAMVTDGEEKTLSGEDLKPAEPEPLLAPGGRVGENGWRLSPVGDGGIRLLS